MARKLIVQSYPTNCSCHLYCLHGYVAPSSRSPFISSFPETTRILFSSHDYFHLPHPIVMLVFVIKATNFPLVLRLSLVLNHLKCYSLMFRDQPRSYHLIIIATMLFLLMISQSIHCFMPSNISLMFLWSLIDLEKLLKSFSRSIIKTIYFDGAGQYQSLNHYLSHHGIQHLKSPPHTPQHIGTEKRKHRHIVETALTLMCHNSIPLKFWSLAFHAAAYLINRLPTLVLNLQSPYEKIFHKPPSYSKLRIFGCLCYPWLRPYTSNKLEPRSRPCIFV